MAGVEFPGRNLPSRSKPIRLSLRTSRLGIRFTLPALTCRPMASRLHFRQEGFFVDAQGLLKRLLSGKKLRKSEKACLRAAYPRARFEAVVERLVREQAGRDAVRQVNRAESVLYTKIKRKKPAKTVYKATSGRAVSAGLPSLGKRR
jgi:hypothetical protein